LLKDCTALGGKVGSAGPGVETEEREAVEVGRDGAKLLTFGVGETDKDAVLQAAKAQVDSIQVAGQKLVAELLHIRRGAGRRRVDVACFGLVKKIID
jgi:hypothetical protein